MKKKSNVCDKKSEKIDKKIDKKIDEKIANILENDIVANTHVLDDYNAEKKDITKYEWLYDSIINDPKYNDLTYEERYNLFIDCSSIVEDSLIKVDDEVVYEYNDKIFMYFLSLENDKMFLYADFKKRISSKIDCEPILCPFKVCVFSYFQCEVSFQMSLFFEILMSLIAYNFSDCK